LPQEPSRLLLALPEPLAVVTAAGDTLVANRALERLAEKCGVAPRLVELFGEPAIELLGRALREGEARASLLLVAGPEPRPRFRLLLAAAPAQNAAAVLMADVTSQVSLRRQLLVRDRTLTVLKKIGVALSETIEIEGLAERIYEQTIRIIDTPNFYLALYDRQAQEVSFPRYVEDGRWQRMTSRPFQNGLTEYLLRTRKPLLINHNVSEQCEALGIAPQGRPSTAWMGVPLLVNDEAIGVIAIQDFERTHCYGPHDLEVLNIIAAQTAASIKSARLVASARRAYDELSATQARLLEAERLRGVTEAVGAMNHEVNNPLAAIAGNAQLLLRNSDGLSADVRVKIEAILEAAGRIQRVTSKMATLIQATSVPYPGETTILDVKRSVSSAELGGGGTSSGSEARAS